MPWEDRLYGSAREHSSLTAVSFTGHVSLALIASWWRYRGDNGQSEKEKRFTKLVINMPSSGHVDIKELDLLGYPKLAGWSRPVVVVEALTKELLRRETLGTGDPVEQEHGD